jgi:hypothetical protein
MLDPITTAHGYQLDDDKHKTLKAVLTKLEKTTEVSGTQYIASIWSVLFADLKIGGEKQRLVACALASPILCDTGLIMSSLLAREHSCGSRQGK